MCELGESCDDGECLAGMRLLFFSNVFPSPLKPTKGVFNLGLVQALAGLGHEVEVVSPIAWTDMWCTSSERRNQVSRHNGEWQGIRASYPIYVYPPGVLRSAYGFFMWRGVRGALRRSIERMRPDAIVAYWTHPDGQCAVRAAREAGIPAAVVCGGSDVLLLTSNHSRRRAIERVLDDADAVITVSDDICRKLIERGVPEDKINVVRRGVDLARFCRGERAEARSRLALEDGRPIFLWVGRLEEVKGLNVLLAALEQLQRLGISYRMLILGSGRQFRSLQADAKARGISDSVEWRGAVPHESLPDYYRAADLTILPSLSEGVPNVLLESIACGTPFVASAVGGIPEIATEGLDRLVPPNDVVALTTAIREQLACRCQEIARRFMPDNSPTAASRLVDVIQSLLEAAPNHSESLAPCLQPAIV
jgi:teichuronic acid biosynthesis glycosyltransferase TuaC